MKKSLCLLTALILLLSLAACGPVSEGPTTPPTGDPTAPPSSDSTMAANTCPCSVMVGGEVFHTYHEKSSVDPDTIQPAGKITHASCNISAIPKENDTSNFETCVGQSYAWVDGDLILFYDNQWNICYRTDEVGGSYKIMVGGILYYTFSKPAPTPADDEIAGNIETCTEGLWVYPTENDQTNHEPFVGQPYAFVEGELVLFYNDQWNTCKPFSELEPSETQPTEAPTTEPTTAPTEPPEPETPWLTAIPEALSYDAYFSEVRVFSYIAGPYSTIWNVNDDGAPGILYSGDPTANAYFLKLDQHGLHVLSYDTQNTVWTVPDTQNLTNVDRYITDGRYAYCIRDQKELLQLNLLTGETEVLATADSFPVTSNYCISLHDRNVLLYLTQTGDKISVNRLYLPTMTLDVLYDEINADAFVGNFYLSYDDTDALLWGIMDPAFIPRLTDILSDPDSDYRKYAVAPNRIWGVTDLAQIVDQQDFITIVQMIEILEETPSLLSCYLDIPSGTYEETPSYWCPDMQEPRGYQDMSHWWSVFARFADPEQTEPVTGQELADAFDKSPFSFIFTLSNDGPWNESREDIVRQLVVAKAGDADTFIEVLREELRYYRTAASKAQPVAQLTQSILDECLRQTGQAE